MARKLTAKQEQFCKEYLIDLNGTQAAIRAGYSKDTAKEIASENLTKPNISECIEKLMADRSKRTEITADRVLEEIAKMAFFNVQDVQDDEGKTRPFNEWSRDDLACIQEISQDKFKVSDKKPNLELLGRHLKLFTDKIELGGSLKISHEQWLDELDDDK